MGPPDGVRGVAHGKGRAREREGRELANHASERNAVVTRRHSASTAATRVRRARFAVTVRSARRPR
jgi:hypothetical protein